MFRRIFGGGSQEESMEMASKGDYRVTFSHNCDGGMQEYNTARDAIMEVHPSANIIKNRVDTYPIQVIVSRVEGEGEGDTELFRSDQRDLFRKYGSRRTTSIDKIKRAVQ
eukprot:334026_1